MFHTESRPTFERTIPSSPLPHHTVGKGSTYRQTLLCDGPYAALTAGYTDHRYQDPNLRYVLQVVPAGAIHNSKAYGYRPEAQPQEGTVCRM